MIYFGEAKLYNSENSFRDMFSDPNWNWIGTTWDISAEGYLTSGSVGSGGYVSFSTEVDGPCTITFEWKKIGNAELRCYYQNAKPQDSAICTKWDWTPGRIRVPQGRHTVTWDFKVKPCEGIVCSVASFRNINIPCMSDSSGEDTSEATVSTEVDISADANDTSIIEVLKRPRDKFEVAEGANLQAVNDAIEKLQKNNEITNKVVLCLKDGSYTGPLNISAKKITIRAENERKAVFYSRSKDFNILLNNTSDIIINGIKFVNRRYGVCVHSCNNCDILGNSIISFDDFGVLVINSTGGYIKNNIIKSSKPNASGICLENSTQFKVEENDIDVTNYYYYFNNQSCNDENFKNIISIKKVINKPYFNISDNQRVYWVCDYRFCIPGASCYMPGAYCIDSPLETNDNIWRVYE